VTYTVTDEDRDWCTEVDAEDPKAAAEEAAEAAWSSWAWENGPPFVLLVFDPDDVDTVRETAYEIHCEFGPDFRALRKAG